jgi:hypothetical protein
MLTNLNFGMQNARVFAGVLADLIAVRAAQCDLRGGGTMYVKTAANSASAQPPSTGCKMGARRRAYLIPE